MVKSIESRYDFEAIKSAIKYRLEQETDNKEPIDDAPTEMIFPGIKYTIEERTKVFDGHITKPNEKEPTGSKNCLEERTCQGSGEEDIEFKDSGVSDEMLSRYCDSYDVKDQSKIMDISSVALGINSDIKVSARRRKLTRKSTKIDRKIGEGSFIDDQSEHTADNSER